MTLSKNIIFKIITVSAAVLGMALILVAILLAQLDLVWWWWWLSVSLSIIALTVVLTLVAMPSTSWKTRLYLLTFITVVVAWQILLISKPIEWSYSMAARLGLFYSCEYSGVSFGKANKIGMCDVKLPNPLFMLNGNEITVVIYDSSGEIALPYPNRSPEWVNAFHDVYCQKDLPWVCSDKNENNQVETWEHSIMVVPIHKNFYIVTFY